MENTDINNPFYEFDKRGVRAFVRYAVSSGTWAIECYRKKRKDESKGDHDWQMIREGYIQTFESRPVAELKALEFAQKIAEENNF